MADAQYAKGVSKVVTFGANLGYYAYYHFKNSTASAGVSCAITSNVPFV